MTGALAFIVPGEPVPAARARVAAKLRRDGQPFVMAYTPASTRQFESKVRTLCQVAVGRARWAWTDRDRFAVTVRVYRTYEGKGGDLDNYAKAVLDGVNGVAFADDRYVRRLVTELAQDAVRPRIEVTVEKL